MGFKLRTKLELESLKMLFKKEHNGTTLSSETSQLWYSKIFKNFILSPNGSCFD